MKEIDEIVSNEGGLVDNPLDRGGITNFGITKATLAVWRKAPVSDEDVRQLTVEEAKKIYSFLFVEEPKFDKLPESVLKSNIIDFGVMSGQKLAILNLQRILNVVEDGVIGPKTLIALQSSNLTTVNNELVKSRVLMVSRICIKDPSQLAFLNGWLIRILRFIR